MASSFPARRFERGPRSNAPLSNRGRARAALEATHGLRECVLLHMDEAKIGLGGRGVGLERDGPSECGDGLGNQSSSLAVSPARYKHRPSPGAGRSLFPCVKCHVGSRAVARRLPPVAANSLRSRCGRRNTGHITPRLRQVCHAGERATAPRRSSTTSGSSRVFGEGGKQRAEPSLVVTSRHQLELA